jgi:hypothetical protein
LVKACVVVSWITAFEKFADGHMVRAGVSNDGRCYSDRYVIGEFNGAHINAVCL